MSARLGLLASSMPPIKRGPFSREHGVRRTSEPMLNVPGVVALMIGVLVLVHVVRVWVLPRQLDIQLLLLFSFVPARYDASVLAQGVLPGGFPAKLWTFVSYAFIHGDFVHLGVNVVWLLAFGSAVARRFGAMRFLAFFAITAAAGAAMHLATHAGELFPMVGASASISGLMAAAMRFAFQRGGPIASLRHADENSYRVPAVPLLTALRDPRILAFLGAWFGLNLLFGLGSAAIVGEGQEIAWEAHIGGFLAGLILFIFFDPVGMRVRAEDREDPDAAPTPG